MIIDLRTILQVPRRFDFTLEQDWWQGDEGDDQVLGFDCPLKVHINISRAGSTYVLKGNFAGGIRARCDLCLEPYHRDLESEFMLILLQPVFDTDQNEIELLKEDMSVDFIMGDEVDLDDIVREQIYLSLPIKFLCRENCSGLCHVCGANLNIEKFNKS